MGIYLSIIYGMAFDLIIFLLLYEYRCSRKMFWTVTGVSISLMSLAIIWVVWQYGLLMAAQTVMATCTIPSCLVFLALARERGTRFLFTFCLADTATMWVLQVSNILGFLAGRDAVTVVLRLIAYPMLAYATWRWFRKPYLNAVHTVGRGWGLFTVITIIFYAAMLLAASYPTLLRDRPYDIPLALLLLTLLPLAYLSIFTILRQQQDAYAARERQGVLEIQAAMMEQRVAEVRSVEERLRIERHDLRHRLDAARVLVEARRGREALDLLDSAKAALDESTPKRYCQNAVVDAVFSLYFRQAQESGVALETMLAIPDELPVDAAELCTVFSNALENALHACAALPPKQRKIRCSCVSSPTLVFEVANTYAGEVHFDPSGLPLSQTKGHGIGVRSIAAFCEKHCAAYRYEASDGWFRLLITL